MRNEIIRTIRTGSESINTVRFACHFQVWIEMARRSREGAKTGGIWQEQGLQDRNPNAPHLRHEGNESGCLKMQRQTDHDPPSQTEKPHFKDRQKAARRQSKKKRITHPVFHSLQDDPGH